MDSMRLSAIYFSDTSISRYRFEAHHVSVSRARACISGEVAKHVGVTIAAQLLGNYVAFQRYRYTVATFARRLLTSLRISHEEQIVVSEGIRSRKNDAAVITNFMDKRLLFHKIIGALKLRNNGL